MEFTDLVLGLITVLIPVLVGYAIVLTRRKLGVEKMMQVQQELETKQDLAALAVRFVEQAYKDADGPEKYDKAMCWLAEQAQRYSINLDNAEIKGLIEATLREIKDEFGEQWAGSLEVDREES